MVPAAVGGVDGVWSRRSTNSRLPVPGGPSVGWLTCRLWVGLGPIPLLHSWFSASCGTWTASGSRLVSQDAFSLSSVVSNLPRVSALAKLAHCRDLACRGLHFVLSADLVGHRWSECSPRHAGSLSGWVLAVSSKHLARRFPGGGYWRVVSGMCPSPWRLPSDSMWIGVGSSWQETSKCLALSGRSGHPGLSGLGVAYAWAWVGGTATVVCAVSSALSCWVVSFVRRDGDFGRHDDDGSFVFRFRLPGGFGSRRPSVPGSAVWPSRGGFPGGRR